MSAAGKVKQARAGDVLAEERHLSHRELRNESGRVLRAVEAGETFVVTNAGVPVGRLVPLDHDPPGLRIVRPARRVGGWSTLRVSRRGAGSSVSEILDDLREERQ